MSEPEPEPQPGQSLPEPGRGPYRLHVQGQALPGAGAGPALAMHEASVHGGRPRPAGRRCASRGGGGIARHFEVPALINYKGLSLSDLACSQARQSAALSEAHDFQ